jgi:hypothetical protein
MIDLGDPNAVLHLFQCQECLGIGDDDTGRAAFILDRDELGDEPSAPEGFDAPAELGLPLIGEAFIDGWDEHDDGIPASRLPEFFDEHSLWDLHKEFPDVKWFDSHYSAKFGGSPRWTGNGPAAFHGSNDFRAKSPQFLFQLDQSLFVSGEAPDANEIGCPVLRFDGNGSALRTAPTPENEKINAPFHVSHHAAMGGYFFDFANLGSDGTLFVFADRTSQPHRVWWFWNR